MEVVYDWSLIEDEYVKGLWIFDKNKRKIHHFPTLEELSERHKPAFSTIQNKCFRDNWVEKRKHYQALIGDDKTFHAELAANLSAESLSQASQLQYIIEKQLSELQNQMEVGQLTIPEIEKVSRVIANLSKSLQTVRNLSEDALKYERETKKAMTPEERESDPQRDYLRLKELIGKAMSAEKSAKRKSKSA